MVEKGVIKNVNATSSRYDSRMHEDHPNWAPMFQDIMHDFKRLLFTAGHLLAEKLINTRAADSSSLLLTYYKYRKSYARQLKSLRQIGCLDGFSLDFDDQNWDCPSIRSDQLQSRHTTDPDVDDCPEQSDVS